MFYPLKTIPSKVLSSIYRHFTNKVLKGNMKALCAMVLAGFDVLINISKIKQYSNRLTFEEYKRFLSLPMVKIFFFFND